MKRRSFFGTLLGGVAAATIFRVRPAAAAQPVPLTDIQPVTEIVYTDMTPKAKPLGLFDMDKRDADYLIDLRVANLFRTSIASVEAMRTECPFQYDWAVAQLTLDAINDNTFLQPAFPYGKQA